MTKCLPQQLLRGRVYSWLMAWEVTIHHGREGTVENSTVLQQRETASYIIARSRENCSGNQVYTLSHKACLLPVTYFLCFLKAPQSPSAMALVRDHVLKHRSQIVAISFNLDWGKQTDSSNICWMCRRGSCQKPSRHSLQFSPHLSANPLLELLLAITGMASKHKQLLD